MTCSFPQAGRVIPVALLLASLATHLAAQVPRVGRDVFEDPLELGFRVKVPRGWDRIPAPPDDPNLIVSYAAPYEGVLRLSSKASLPLSFSILELDTRPREERRDPVPVKTALRWIDRRLEYAEGWRADPKAFPEHRPQPLAGPKDVQGTWIVYEARHRDDPDVAVRVYVAELELAEGLRVALVGNGPATRRWHAYEKAWARMARSFERLELERTVEAAAKREPSDRARARERLRREVASAPGWSLHESPAFLLVTESDDDELVAEVLRRLEAVRALLEADFPRAADDEPAAPAPVPVVRLCTDLGTYHRHGGGDGPARWNLASEELVLRDTRAEGGREALWEALQHEAVHQLIFARHGRIAPHAWFEEGLGDCYAGFALDRTRLEPRPLALRAEAARTLLASGRHAPLREFVRWSQAEHLGGNEAGLGPADTYAQAWALVWFLRSGPTTSPKGWNPDWDDILTTYLHVLARTRDPDEAVARAFEGVDWDALEACWRRTLG